MTKDFKFSNAFKIHNTQLNRRQLFWPKSTILKSKSAKCRNLQKIVTEIF